MMAGMRMLAVLVVVSAIMMEQSWADQSHYDILQVSREASQAEIKRQFRKLSLLYHPDKNPGDEAAAEKFKEINRAYEILSDADKRQVYDQYGPDGVERYESGNLNRQKSPNSKADIKVTLEELYLGTTRDLTITRNVNCPKCRGTGSKDGKLKQCDKCKGSGTVMQKITMGLGMQMQMQTTCDKCGGRGQSTAANCPHCRGKKVVNDQKTLHVIVEKGMADGDTIVFEREAEQIPDMIAGDVIFKIKQTPNKKFKRVQDNLYTDLEISLEEALLGFKKRIQHLDGHLVEVSSKPDEVIQPFSWKIIKDEGMPKRNIGSEYGDLHVKMIIVFPKSLSQEQKKLISMILPE